MALQDTLDALRAKFEAGGPPFNAPGWIHEPMHRATRELIASGAADNALKVGSAIPPFGLNDPDGKRISSTELLAAGPLVITFYRGVWCPYCNLELKALQDVLPAIAEHGASLVAISPQTPPNSRRSRRDNELSFPILSDPHNNVAAAFGLRYQLPEYLKKVYLDVFNNNLAVTNGDDSWTLPMPARYVVGQDGVVLYAEVNPDYTRRPDPAELLPALASARQLATLA